MPDRNLIITEETLAAFRALRSQPKFHEKGLYPGAPNEEIRQRSESAVNAMLDRLLIGIQGSPQKSYVFSEFKQMLPSFEHEDTEEREQACAYLERVMAVLNIESSDGLLNTWLYGFDPE